MTSFLSVQYYSPLAVALVGGSTLVGLWGVGTVLLRTVPLRIASPWSCVTATLLGIQILCLVVQIAGMLGIASPVALSTTWVILVALGLGVLLIQLLGVTGPVSHKRTTSTVLLVSLIGVAVCVNLLVAIAPSTKIDELYYHMLVPSRIVSDGAMQFYRMPWQAAIWPQMAYQISSAPLHAIGYPDAANVVSWGLGVMLVWFAWRIISSHTASPVWSAFWAGALCIGMYPVVWHVTGGAHAMGDLAMAAAIVAFADRDELGRTIAPPAHATMVSILLLAAATSKVSLVPACAVLFAVSGWNLLRSAPALSAKHVVLGFAIPWLLLCPILIWTWIHSGSPFGPMLAGFFGSSVYSLDWLQDTFEGTRHANQPALFETVYHIALGYSPIVWLGVIGAIFGTDLPRATRATLGLLLGLQVVLIYFLLPHDPRFLGGIHYGMLIAFASHPTQRIQNFFSSTRVAVAVASLLLLPWLGLQLYYAKQFFPVSLGIEKEKFYLRYIALYDDFMKLDGLLTQDTVMLAPGYRVSSVYAPRPIFFDPSDISPGKKVVLLSIGQVQPSPVDGFGLGEVIYRNPQAVIASFRTPGRSPIIDYIQVTQLHREISNR